MGNDSDWNMLYLMSLALLSQTFLFQICFPKSRSNTSHAWSLTSFTSCSWNHLVQFHLLHQQLTLLLADKPGLCLDSLHAQSKFTFIAKNFSIWNKPGKCWVYDWFKKNYSIFHRWTTLLVCFEIETKR